MYSISLTGLDFETIERILRERIPLKLSEDAKQRIREGRRYLDLKLKEHKEPIYGINTGFGSLYNKSINEKDLGALQVNLMKSHACGTGDEVHPDIVRLMLLLKIQGLSYGNSGVQLQTVERLIDFFNKDILPVVYQQGSWAHPATWLRWLIFACR